MTPAPIPGLITKTPGVCGGEACVRSTRLTVWTLVNSRRLGVSEQQLMADYPSLTAEDLHAAWDYYVVHPQEIDDAIDRNEAAAPRPGMSFPEFGMTDDEIEKYDRDPNARWVSAGEVTARLNDLRGAP